MKYKIIFSEEADNDLLELSDTITYNYGAPQTAVSYLDGIFKEIKKLETAPHIYAIRNTASLLQFGLNVRRLNYKKMAIIYTINDDIVYIHRVIAQNLITGLN